MSEEEKALTTIDRALTTSEFGDKHRQLIKFVQNQLREAKDIKKGGDYGVIPFTNKKSLLKPGAEKLLKLFGLSAKQDLVKEFEDFEHGFVLYKYRCTITHVASGKVIADSVRSCNNKETKHKTKNVYDVANTIEAIAQKRALVAATVQATMASEIFDADISDHDEEAPARSVTKEEDPRRNKVMMGLYGVAREHGWDDSWIHKAIKQKWGVDSLTECSNDQIEELKEFIMIKYKTVDKGQKPELLPNNKSSISVDDTISEGEIVDTLIYRCKGEKHTGKKDEEIPVVPLGEFCSSSCRDSYYPPKNTKEPRTDFTFNRRNIA